MSRRAVFVLLRWVIALTMMAQGAVMLVKAATDEGGGYAGAMGRGLFGFAFVIAGAVLVSPEVVEWVAGPVCRFITGIVFPDDKFARPPVNYALPRGYRKRFRPEDAIPEYLKIIRHHPQETDAYIECMEVMIETGDRRGARRVRDAGLRKLRSAEARELVSRMHAALTETGRPLQS